MTKTVQISKEEQERNLRFIEEGRRHVARLEEALGRAPYAAVITFGCQMNARDSEKLSGILQSLGYRMTEEEDAADFVIFNTCTVRENADDRLYGRVGRLRGIKAKKPHMRIAVCGCMTQELSAVEKLRESYTHVDLIFGTFNLHRFAELIVTMFESDRQVVDIWREAGEVTEDLPVLRKHFFKSGVNIMYGCDNFCSFCIVPYVRGRERSRASADILAEVRALVEDGVKEVMLLGQNVNSYGNGVSGELSFPELLREVCRIEGVERVRFMSSHPKDLSEELIAVMRDEAKCARHLHLALQSGSDRILREMNRHYTKADFLHLVRRIREEIPDMAITTDIIVGYPGETDADVQDTIDVIEAASFDNAFTFVYSKRTGTRAAALERIPEGMTKEEYRRTVQDRFDRVLRAVQDKARTQSSRFVGQSAEVLVEGVNAKDPSLLTGRMSNNLLVHFPGSAALTGQMVRVRLERSMGFYYLGQTDPVSAGI
ncbi:MAG: tRNA (N6-isopentenyl adenosine(37)-C2)-methylthiotransferase MiaB [Lachnospiraceae bacterium]|nr:tRNA (N6-isopentenyl adenosine(37)-C2)-methylthiotransferase MiaB [Lachnospiraceae bacterium]